MYNREEYTENDHNCWFTCLVRLTLEEMSGVGNRSSVACFSIMNEYCTIILIHFCVGPVWPPAFKRRSESECPCAGYRAVITWAYI